MPMGVVRGVVIGGSVKCLGVATGREDLYSSCPQSYRRLKQQQHGGHGHGHGAVAVAVQASIRIDKRRHLDESLRRQEEEDARLAEADISCPIECVRTVFNLTEFEKILLQAEKENDLVVVDFFNSSCGACKYMLPQFVKLCKKGCLAEECIADEDDDDNNEGHHRRIVFVKHNVLDDYDELTDLAQSYAISAVPMFAIFRNGALVEKFATRDKKKLEQSVCRLLQG